MHKETYRASASPSQVLAHARNSVSSRSLVLRTPWRRRERLIQSRCEHMKRVDARLPNPPNAGTNEDPELDRNLEQCREDCLTRRI